MNNPVFEVYVNGELVTKAGITADLGVLSMITTWVKRATYNDESLSLTVSGLNSIENTHLDWYGSELKIGDEINIKITDQKEVTNPTIKQGWTMTDESILEDKLKRFYSLKEELKEYIDKE
ncbi:hypothetical protein [Pedobacter nyackensis]|uniref:hypothetical protein n=1 Tax=Pedobacter nyackensis TaxID=475255 RepID=UPI00292F5702|nr:hypothetical protein [Pedobacter nyackensis]